MATLVSKHTYDFDFVTGNEHRLGVYGLVEDYDSSNYVKQFSKFFREGVCRTTKFYLPPGLYKEHLGAKMLQNE